MDKKVNTKILMKKTICITTYNEVANIESLLLSLKLQTVLPHKLIIADGGSSDGTVEKIKAFAKKNRAIKVDIIQEMGSSISKGRNSAIRHAPDGIIVQIDAGCKAHYKWFDLITAPFDNDQVTVVAGFYTMVAKFNFQKAARSFFGITKERYSKEKFIPSARSVAFRKDVWKKVGGYNESLDKAGEDTLFFYNILKSGYSIYHEPRAIVYWEVPKTLKESLNKFYNYAKGDAQTHIFWHPTQRFASHTFKIMSIYLRYLIFVCLLLLSLFNFSFFLIFFFVFGMYCLWSIWKFRDIKSNYKIKLLYPILQISSDLAIMLGYAAGTIG